MSSAEEAVVSAHGWILGITYSILASIVGGASKLSIRKSWLIDAKRKQGIEGTREAYDEISSPTAGNNRNMNSTHGSESSMNSFIPLEVGQPQSHTDTASPNNAIHGHYERESLSDEDDGVARANATKQPTGYFSSNNSIARINSILNNRLRRISNSGVNRNAPACFLSPKQISWTLYISGMIGMTFINPLFCVLAMKYANPSILAPFSGLTLVWVVLFSYVTVGEHVGRSQKVACALIVTGEVLVAAFGDHTNGEDKSVEDVLASYHEPAFQMFMLFMTLFLLQLTIFICTFPDASLLKKVAWGSIGGSITGFQNFLKDTLTIYSAATRSSQQNSSTNIDSTASASLPPTLFLFVVLAMLTAFIGLLCLAACMKRYDATYSAAMFVVSFVLSASLMSSVHYHTFDHLEGVTNYIMYPVGLITLFLGAYTLVKPKAIAVTGGCTALLDDVDADDDDMDEVDAHSNFVEA